MAKNYFCIFAPLQIALKMQADLLLYKTIVVANGTFPERGDAPELLRHAEHLVCCDGAIDKVTAHGLTPTAVVGDCDSMQAESLERWAGILHPDKSEEYNDLQKALRYCLRERLSPVALIGCEGLREDHFLANLSIMATYSEWLPLVMVTQDGVFNILRQSTTLVSHKGQQVSVFCIDTQLPLTFHGLKYPVKQRAFQHLWEGSLNEALGDAFTIELHGEGIVIVYRAR